MDRKHHIVAVVWLAVTLGGVTAAVATPPQGKVTRNELIIGKVAEAIDIARDGATDIHIAEVSIDPGSDTGWHTHPGAEFGLVKSGEIVLTQAPGCKPVKLTAGQGGFIAEGTAHLARNEGTVAAQLYALTFAPGGNDKIRVDADAQCSK